MEIREIIPKVDKAIKDLFDKDPDLLRLDVNERSISHKLAEYLQKEFPDYNVDCEYNRHLDATKELDLPKDKIDWNDTEAKTVFPDIVIHRRNTDKHNLVVIEIKKSNNRVDRRLDENKL